MTKEFYQEMLPFLLILFSVILSGIVGLVVWFYKLNETRMNARVGEIKELHGIIDNMKDEREIDRKLLTQLSTEQRLFKEYQEKGFTNLEKIIADKMDSIKELFTEKLKNQK